jgi:phosphatidylethanolamine-binding protein (PEBP) family uncharacterized protein
MRKALPAISSITLCLALTGCGGASTSTDSATAAVRIVFKSPAITAKSIPALYTCDGKNVHPPLEWGSVPAGTRELVLLSVGLEPTGTGYYSSSVQWAVAGLSPELRRLAAGAMPSGAYLGDASEGRPAPYSVCPKKGVHEQYQFMLFAVPMAIKVRAGFPALAALAGLSQGGTSSSALGKGTFVAAYTRR